MDKQNFIKITTSNFCARISCFGRQCQWSRFNVQVEVFWVVTSYSVAVG